MRDRPLNDLMEFEHVIRVMPDGEIHDRDTHDIYAPGLYMNCDDEGSISAADEADYIRQANDQGWQLLKGFTGQYSYAGVIMHPSEYVGGYLEDHIRQTPGLYVTITVDTADDDDEPAGWAIAYREEA